VQCPVECFGLLGRQHKRKYVGISLMLGWSMEHLI
jgi:hypothetical protein